MSPPKLEPRPFDHPDVQAFLAQIQQLYEVLYGGHDEDAMDPGEFAPPNGVFLVGYLDGIPVACGGWRRGPAGSAEIKRMFVAEQVRGTGLARRLLAALEDNAASVGVRRMVLNTGYRQTEAMALYESSGYVRTEDRYGHYRDMAGAYFFAKTLS